jgi:hypothetical protein
VNIWGSASDRSVLVFFFSCFLAIHEIRLGPRYTAIPPLDLPSSIQPAQLAYEKALTSVEDDLQKVSPRPTVPLTYLNILFTAVQ